MAGETISIRYHLSPDDFAEGEDGMARHLGVNPPRRGGLGAIAFRSVIGLAGRLLTTTNTISGDGILISGGGPLHRWADFADTFETDSLVVFVLASTSGPIVLPKGALTPAQLGVVREYATHVGHDHDRVLTIRTEGIAVADLKAAQASGGVSDAMYPFEEAKLHFAETGRRRLFVCGRCGKGISLAWKRCDHCKATFDEFPPFPTGEEV